MDDGLPWCAAILASVNTLKIQLWNNVILCKVIDVTDPRKISVRLVDGE